MPKRARDRLLAHTAGLAASLAARLRKRRGIVGRVARALDDELQLTYAAQCAKFEDDLIDRIEGVQSREELQTVMKCVDRVLRAYHFWIPNWHSANHRIAMWDMFGWPDAKPDYFFPVEQLWWVDPDKAATIESRL